MWKCQADFYKAELLRKQREWEDREQQLVSEMYMRDAHLTELEDRVRLAESTKEVREVSEDVSHDYRKLLDVIELQERRLKLLEHKFPGKARTSRSSASTMELSSRSSASSSMPLAKAEEDEVGDVLIYDPVVANISGIRAEQATYDV